MKERYTLHLGNDIDQNGYVVWTDRLQAMLNNFQELLLHRHVKIGCIKFEPVRWN